MALRRTTRLCVLLLFAIPMLAQTGAVTTTEQTPVPVFTDHCAGEDLQFNGMITVQTTTWTDVSGGFHTRVRQLPSLLRGVGLTTGLSYWLLSSGTEITFNGPQDGLPFSETAIFQQLILGQGVQNHFVLSLFNLRINADGSSTPEIDQMIDKCFGH